MNREALKTWIDAMPIDDVRRRIERLETKLADLRVLERLYAERHPGCGEGGDESGAESEQGDEPG